LIIIRWTANWNEMLVVEESKMVLSSFLLI